MTLSPTQLKDRRLDIAGEIKQSRLVVAECRQDLALKLTAVDIANNALARACDREAELVAERLRLAEMAHADFLQAGEEDLMVETTSGGPEQQTPASEAPEPIAGLPEGRRHPAHAWDLTDAGDQYRAARKLPPLPLNLLGVQF